MFKSVIRQSEQLLVLVGNSPIECKNNSENNAAYKTESSFSIDMGCYPPLYYTALKCRIPRLRRRAVELLERCRHVEGLWTGPLLARLAMSVIEMEEQGFSTALKSSCAVSSDNYADKTESIASRKATTSENSSPSEPSSSSLPPSFTLPEFSRFHCVRCVLPPKSQTFGATEGNTYTGGATLIGHRFRHELGRNGGWEAKTWDVDFRV